MLKLHGDFIDGGTHMDCTCVFKIPHAGTNAFATTSSVVSGTYLTDLLTVCGSISHKVEQQYQTFLACFGSNVDVHHSDCALMAVKKSCYPKLFTPVKQSFDKVPACKRGCLSLFMLIVGKLC